MLRDSLVLTGTALVLLFIATSTVFVTGTGLSSLRQDNGLSDLNPLSTDLLQSATQPYPTTVHQDIRSIVVTVNQTESQTWNHGQDKDKHDNDDVKGQILNHGKHLALGQAKHQDPGTNSSYTFVEIRDNITVTAINGYIPGHNDTIVLTVYFGSDTTPYFTGEHSFIADGLTSYSVAMSCEYMGTGTYNFKVNVYDDSGTVIGDPETGLSL